MLFDGVVFSRIVLQCGRRLHEFQCFTRNHNKVRDCITDCKKALVNNSPRESTSVREMNESFTCFNTPAFLLYMWRVDCSIYYFTFIDSIRRGLSTVLFSHLSLLAALGGCFHSINCRAINFLCTKIFSISLSLQSKSKSHRQQNFCDTLSFFVN